MINQQTREGHTLAVIGSVILLGAAIALVLIGGMAAYFTWVGGRTLDSLVTTTPLPAAAMLTWLATVAGTVASIIAIVLYDFRARWFWRCLVGAAILWLLAPPAGTVVGLISLIVLLTMRRRFPPDEDTPHEVTS
jgi:hypothetical protein